jgi:hypothetical protein
MSEKKFFEVLEELLLPLLDETAFRGSKWFFTRSRPPFIDALWLQVNKERTKCAVNLGVHLDFIPAKSGKSVDASSIQVGDWELATRLTRDLRTGDQWWPFGRSKSETEASANDLVHAFRTRGLAFYQRFNTLPGPFAAITPESIAAGTADPETLPSQTQVRAALLLARLYQHLGDTAKAKQFADVGMRHIGMAVNLKRPLQEILEGGA